MGGEAEWSARLLCAFVACSVCAQTSSECSTRRTQTTRPQAKHTHTQLSDGPFHTWLSRTHTSFLADCRSSCACGALSKRLHFYSCCCCWSRMRTLCVCCAPIDLLLLLQHANWRQINFSLKLLSLVAMELIALLSALFVCVRVEL